MGEVCSLPGPGRADILKPIAPQRGPLDQPFNEEYVRRLIEGHKDVEDHFTSYFQALLVVKIRRNYRTREMVADATQETFLRVFRNLRRNPGLLERPEKLGSYVLGVCNNVLMEMGRSAARFRVPEESELDPTDPTQSPEDLLCTAERKQMVHLVLNELPEKDRKLIRLVFLEELDKDDVCRSLGVDRNYLRVLLHRAIGRCKALLISEKKRAAGDAA